MSGEPDRLLEIYLADHLAAATAGAELARRVARNNATGATGDVLRRLRVEIEEDRQTLRRIVAGLGLRASRPKEALAWAGEKLARLKLNGRLRGYSPLSRLLELETLSVGIAGKVALWEALQRVPDVDRRLPSIDLEQLAERARRQRAEVEELRLGAAERAFVE